MLKCRKLHNCAPVISPPSRFAARPMARVLVTGATGFIGRRLVRRLAAEGHEVTCLVRSEARGKELAPQGVRLSVGDVARSEGLAEACRGAEIVFHLAGLVRALSARTLADINGEGVRRLAEACRQGTSPPVFVLVSSLAVAGPAVDGRPREPSDPPRPISNYGRSKLAGELAARPFAAQMPITIVRPAIAFGPGDPTTFDWFRSVYRFGLHIVPGRRVARFSLVDVDDLAEILLRAAARGVRIPAERDDDGSGRGIYYAAHPEPPSYAEIGELAAGALGGRRYRTVRVPMPLVWAAGAAGELLGRAVRRPATLNWDKAREAAAGSWICSPATVVEQLNFEFRETLAEQFRRAVDWYRTAGWFPAQS
jgi:dihydroflavonol-4-reductase